ncbi:MAG TPA: DUF3459 domain-containing protein, partial [Verrucomicrobiae bacterium]|nr:DUF3459 domain-containing protein [Verrucomicrobiae bacterium]
AQAHGGFVSYKHNTDGSKSPYELNINYFDALSNPADREPIETQVRRFMVAQAIMLSLTGVPGIYFHSLFGSRNDRAGAEASGIPRRINRQKLARTELERDLADPASLRSRILGDFRKLLHQRRSNPAFHPASGQEILSLEERVFAVRRASPDGSGQTLCLHNLSGSPVSFSVAGRDHTLQAHDVKWVQERPGNGPPSPSPSA